MPICRTLRLLAVACVLAPFIHPAPATGTALQDTVAAAELAGLQGRARVDRIAELLQVRRDSDPAGGLRLAEAGLELAKREKYRKGEAEMLTGLGTMLNLVGRNGESHDRHRDAIGIFRTLSEPALLAGALRAMGVTLYDLAQYDDAIEHYLEALGLSESLGDARSIGRAAANIGNVYRMTGQPREALKYQARAYEALAAAGDTLGMSGVSINMGVLHSALGAELRDAGDEAGYRAEIEAARMSYERALAGFEAIGNPRGIASATHNLGGVYRRLGELAKAREYQERAFAQYQAMGNEVGQIESLVAVAMTLRESGSAALSLARLEEALQRAQAAGNRSVLAGIYNELSVTHESLGDFPSALAALRHHARLRDEESRERMESRIAQLTSDFAAERADREIALLRADQQGQELRIYRQRALIGTLAGGVSIVLLMLALIYSRYRAGTRFSSHLDQVARTDPLTGLPNRRDLIDRIDLERRRAKREGVPFAVVLGDLDDFKAINDNHGHDAGDHTLIHAGARLRSALRASDYAGRWGGEEFLVVLPGTRLAEALAVAERMRDAIEISPAEWRGIRLPVTVTLGVAVFDSDTTLDACVRAADQALRTGKRRGKNRVLAIGA